MPWSDPALWAAGAGFVGILGLLGALLIRGQRIQRDREGVAERRRPKLSDRLAEQERETGAHLRALGYSEDEVRRALEPIQTFRAIVRENEAEDERRRART